ncbi:MAG: cell division protein FtsZ [Peptostreptococcaceae bacterium]|jgi:cell division protein FtsZ|nr:cell division protein FtsZ [Peptostreptococcaceae bacterium]
MENFLSDIAADAKIKVIGVGGGGGNTVGRMIEENVKGVEYICVNTDAQALKNSPSNNKVHIGQILTKGLGAGANPEIGSKALLESENEVKELLVDTDMLFITAGMGGGTGTGAAPEIARIAKDLDILTVAIVTIPFKFEGRKRSLNANYGLDNLKKNVDTLIVVSNEKLLTLADKKITMTDAFKTADKVVTQGIQGISDLISVPGIINLDFADIQTIMKNKGEAYMGMGVGHGENRAIMAIENALKSPLVERNINNATGVLMNVTSNMDLGLFEVSECAEYMRDFVHEDANVIFGASIDDSLNDKVKVTIIGTGFNDGEDIKN